MMIDMDLIASTSFNSWDAAFGEKKIAEDISVCVGGGKHLLGGKMW